MRSESQAEPAAASEPTPLTLVVGSLALPNGAAWPEGSVDVRPTEPAEALHRIESDAPALVLLWATLRLRADGGDAESA